MHEPVHVPDALRQESLTTTACHELYSYEMMQASAMLPGGTQLR